MNKSVYFLFVLLLSAASALACKCSFNEDIKKEKDIKKYAFIGRVKISALEEFKADSSALSIQARWSFTILEKFKGSDTLRSVMEPMYMTDCRKGLAVGEEWLIFAEVSNGRLVIQACERTSRLAEKDSPAYTAEDGRRFLEQLRKLNPSTTGRHHREARKRPLTA